MKSETSRNSGTVTTASLSGTLARRLAEECSEHVELGRLHTTASHHYQDHYIEVTRQKFDDMILAGEFLTYSEHNGESYGLSELDR